MSRKLPFVLAKKAALELIAKDNNIHHQFIMKFLLFTGVRVSELLNIKLEDINLKEGKLLVRQGKGAKDREVIISPDFLSELRFLADRFIPIHLTRYSVFHFVKELGKKNNCPQLHPHTFRHSHATMLVEGGTGLNLVAEQLGHTNMNTTRIYTHLSTGTRKKLMNWG